MEKSVAAAKATEAAEVGEAAAQMEAVELEEKESRKVGVQLVGKGRRTSE